MTKFKLKEADAQKLLNYLATRPYIEVFELVPILTTAEREETTEVANEKVEETKAVTPEVVEG